MNSPIPKWVAQYVGISFDIGGRSKEVGLDCWGLVCVVYKEQFQIELPQFEGVYNESESDREQQNRLQQYVLQERMAIQQRGVFYEVPKENAREGDLIIIRTLGQPLHIGIVVVAGLMLNAREGCDTIVESYRHPVWSSRIDLSLIHI